jgi:O-antigen/teichoic acid export membrane protein
MTRSARSTWNYLTVLLFGAVTMAVSLIVTPLLLRYLGDARLGAARAVMDWAGYLTLLELGLGGALLPMLARELSRDGQAGVRGVLAAGFRAYTRVAMIMIAGAVVLVLLIPRLVRIDPSLQHDLRLATIIAAVPLLLMPLSPLRSLAEASQRGYVVNLFLIVQSLAIASCALIAAKIGWGITGQLGAIAIGAMLFGALMVADAMSRRRQKSCTPSPRSAGEREMRRRAACGWWKELWRLNTPTLIVNVCGRVGLLSDNIIIGSIVSASAIVPFLMTQRIAQLAQTQLTAVGSSTWAGLAELYARGEHALFRRRFIELTRLVTMLGLCVLLPIVAFNHAFVRMWVGQEQFAGMTITGLAGINALMVSLAALWGWVFGGTGKLDKLAGLSMASAAVNLIVSAGFTWIWSKTDVHRALLGPVLGTTCGYALLTLPILPLLLQKHFGIGVRELWVAVGGPVLVGAPYGALLMWWAGNHPPGGWIALGMEMGISALVFAGLCWAVLLEPDDRAMWKLRMRLASGTGAG